MPKFVILLHRAEPGDKTQIDHWDLMIERPDSKGRETGLLTWSFHKPPVDGLQCEAKRLPEHRSLYLDYEGPISGGRGSVEQILKGDAEWIEYGNTKHRVHLKSEHASWLVELCETSNQRLSISFFSDDPSGSKS